ncbi:hypothetical protein [Paenibacillus pini]|uniref:hypothetical protein n=1 Tax=Paenibacillus pini TaxID=669461 RepID=UPI000A652E34|nr:hypothetical protein [Paenibacillus pini]
MTPKYNKQYYTGCKENNGYEIIWNSGDPELEPTEIFSFGYRINIVCTAALRRILFKPD